VGLFDAGSRGRDPTTQTVHDRVFTVANGVSFLRLLGLPVFVWLMVVPQAYGIALTVLITVATTDWLDGYIARRFDQVTRLGKWLDPLLDRALLATTCLTLAVLDFLPDWILVLVIGRDVLVLGGGYLVFRGAPPIPVSRMGKFGTACLLIGIPGFLVAGMDFAAADVFGILAWTVTVVGLVAYYVAGAQYGRIVARMVRRS
jgi:cardiolipin synthase (CMP-forming)